MWLTFNSIEYKSDLVSPKTGKQYAGYIIKGMKRGFPIGAPDVPWQRTVFDTTTCTVIEQGITRPNKSIVQFFQKAVKPGDKVEIRSEKSGTFWEISSVENITNRGRNIPTYEPLSQEEIDIIKAGDTEVKSARIPTAGSEGSDLPPWLA